MPCSQVIWVSQGECWKLYDTLIVHIWLTFISYFVYLYMTKQACMLHVFYRPIYSTVPRAYNGTLSVCFLRISRELWVGVNRCVIAKLLNQVNKSWGVVQIFTFSTPAAEDAIAILKKGLSSLVFMYSKPGVSARPPVMNSVYVETVYNSR